MKHGIEQALESIAGWDMWADEGIGAINTATCPNCGFTGTMDPPVGIMPAPKKIDQSMAAAAFYDSYQDLRDALSEAVSTLVKYAWVVDFGADWVVYGDPDDADGYWRSTYSVGDTGTITLLDKVDVHRVFVAVPA